MAPTVFLATAEGETGALIELAKDAIAGAVPYATPVGEIPAHPRQNKFPRMPLSLGLSTTILFVICFTSDSNTKNYYEVMQYSR